MLKKFLPEKLLDLQIKETLQNREMQVERYINYFRIFVMIVSAFDDFFLASAVEDLKKFIPGILSWGVFLGILFYVIHKFTSSWQYKPWIKYLATTIDFLLLLEFIADYREVEIIQKFISLDGQVAFFFSFLVLLNILSALRFSPGLIIYSGVLTLSAGVWACLEQGVPMMIISLGIPTIAISIILGIAASLGLRSLLIQLEQRNYLARFLPRQLVDTIDRGEISLKLGGEEKEVTILLADIRGFTTISEQMKPQELVGLLNVYLTHMAEVIFDQGGTLDKFMGDAILAVFGSPVAREDDPRRAYLSAQKMHDMVEKVNRDLKKSGMPSIEVGIALHTGKVISGNIGSPRRMEFTVIGDAVNVASRIEKLNKKYKTRLLITEDTYKKVEDIFDGKIIAETTVRGRKKPIKIYGK